MLPVSRDTLLRVVRRRALPPSTGALQVVGIDDFAWKRGQRYGTIICDLERRRIVDLLPDREAGTVAAWLAEHSEIRVVSRDRDGDYGRAATEGASQAIQVADRWHLMENASAAFLEAVRRSMPPIRQALGSTVIKTALLTCAERIQYDGFVRQQAIKALAARVSRWSLPGKRPAAANWCAACCAAAMATCSAVGRTHWAPPCPGSRPNGTRTATTAQSWRRMRAGGFGGGLRVVTEWATRRRRGEKAGRIMSRTVPPARQVSRMMTIDREHSSKADAITVAAIESGVPALGAARILFERFQQMLRARDIAALAPWLLDAGGSLLASFGKGLSADLAAVRAAFAEGQVVQRPD